MTSCTIIVSHFESLPFLIACIRQIRKYANSEIFQKIIIVDQSSNKTFVEVINEFYSDDDVWVIGTKPFYSGYGLDYVMQNVDIKTDYICQLHVDAFPIHKNWLYLPIKLIEENNFSFVGQLHFYSRKTDTIYPPTPFFSMSPTFNVARTETYKELSLKAGFTRFHERKKTDMTFENNDWATWAEKDYDARGSDDDVVAFCWNGKYKTDDMLGLAISGYIESSYGRIIDDIVFHFCSCRESIGVMGSMPDGYKKYSEKINENYSDELIDEMVNLAKTNRPPELEILSRNFWDGELKKSFPPTEELNKRIQQLKNGLD